MSEATTPKPSSPETYILDSADLENLLGLLQQDDNIDVATLPSPSVLAQSILVHQPSVDGVRLGFEIIPASPLEQQAADFLESSAAGADEYVMLLRSFVATYLRHPRLRYLSDGEGQVTTHDDNRAWRDKIFDLLLKIDRSLKVNPSSREYTDAFNAAMKANKYSSNTIGNLVMTLNSFENFSDDQLTAKKLARLGNKIKSIIDSKPDGNLPTTDEHVDAVVSYTLAAAKLLGWESDWETPKHVQEFLESQQTTEDRDSND